MVQYAVLLLAHKYHELLDYTDNIQLMATLAKVRFLSRDEVWLLSDAYCRLRAAMHRDTLRGKKSDEEGRLAELRAGVRRIWEQLMEQEPRPIP